MLVLPKWRERGGMNGKFPEKMHGEKSEIPREPGRCCQAGNGGASARRYEPYRTRCRQRSFPTGPAMSRLPFRQGTREEADEWRSTFCVRGRRGVCEIGP